MKVILLFRLLVLVTVLQSCSQRVSREEAGEFLTGPQKWKLKEVTVNGKSVFRDGKSIEQFGEVGFNRFMEEVSFDEDGRFIGVFSDNNQQMALRWDLEEEEVIVRDTIPNSGKWRIPYVTLTRHSFEMTTETNAYDPSSAITRIRLRFMQ